MPVIAAAAIASGAVSATALVAGLTYASAGLYAVGKITGNEKLMKLSAITGLAAGATGLVQGLSAGAGSAINEASHFSDAAFEAGMEGAASGVVDGASWASPAADIGGSALDQAGFEQLAEAPQSLINENIQPPTSAIENPVISTGEQSQGIINEASQSPAAPDGAEGGYGSNLPKGPMPDDPGLFGKAKKFWDGLDDKGKLSVSQFVAKGFGAVSDFVGPKSELTKAQAGLANTNSQIGQAQLANISQTAAKIAPQSYTFTPRIK